MTTRCGRSLACADGTSDAWGGCVWTGSAPTVPLGVIADVEGVFGACSGEFRSGVGVDDIGPSSPHDAGAVTGGAGSTMGCVTAQVAWTRAGVTATLAVVLGALLHEFAGGDAAASGWLAVGSLGALVAARLAQGHLGSPARAAAALILGQVLVHVCLPMSGRGAAPGAVAGHAGAHIGGAAAAGSAGSPTSQVGSVPFTDHVVPGPTTGVMADHAQDAALRHSGTGFGPTAAHAVAESLACLFANPGMLAAHLLAAAALGWWLARGERLAVRLGALLTDAAHDVVRALSWWSPIADRFFSCRSALCCAAAASTAASDSGQRWMVTATARRGPPVLA